MNTSPLWYKTTFTASAHNRGYFDPSKGAMFYITDWQGNNIAVVDSKGRTAQQATYYPYGEPTVEPSGQRYLFGGKEREHAAGLNTYDFGARSLTPYGIWPSPDPFAEKYYNISPYSYCGGDPINRVDPTGKIIEFADSSNVEFINAFNDAVLYLKEYGASEWVDNIINSEKTYVLTAPSKDSDPLEKNCSVTSCPENINENSRLTLLWDYRTVIETSTEYIISPAEILSHEADHLYRTETDWKAQKEDINKTIDEYGNEEEKRVITGSEQTVAKRLGRLQPDGYTRKSHGQMLLHLAIGVRGKYIPNPNEFIVYGKTPK